MYKFRTLLVITIALASCGKTNQSEPDTSDIQLTVQSERWENELFQSKTRNDVLGFLAKHPELAANYFPDVVANDTILATKLFENISNPALQAFKKQIDSTFRDLQTSVVQPLEDAFKKIKFYYPDFHAPKVVTMLSGFLGRDLFISDSLVVIGIDYFGGPTAMYRPDVYDYQLNNYAKPYIVPSVLFFLSERYNKLDVEDKTLLADMIWVGKGFEFVKKVAPQTPDSLIIGYSERNLTRTYNSQTDIWGFFVENKLLYETNEQKKNKYVGERPKSTEIGDDVPGGVGKWLGWRIVARYLAENPKVTLPQLMNTDKAQQILIESGYKGQLDE